MFRSPFYNMEEDKLANDHDKDVLEHSESKENQQKDKDTNQGKQDVPVTETPLQDDTIADSFVDLDINKDESTTNVWREESEGPLNVTPVAAATTTTNNDDNRPLESGNDSSLDPWQEDTSLLHGRDSPDEPIPVTVAPVVHVEHHDEQETLDKDISHTKVNKMMIVEAVKRSNFICIGLLQCYRLERDCGS